MATTKFYFDCRAKRSDGRFQLKLAITKHSRTALFPLGVYLSPDQWDVKESRVKNHPKKQQYNTFINARRVDVEHYILQLIESGEYGGMTAQQIKDGFVATENPDAGAMTLERRYVAFMQKKQPTTRALYEYTLKRMRHYCPNLSRLSFEDITVKWLEGFESYLAETSASKNYRNIHLRNIRAVFNEAIDEGDTTFYPFRKFKIRPVPTRKRAMSVEALRKFASYPVEEYAEIYRDMFMLIFMLIGINSVDLHRLKEVSAEGRIEYTRAKTHRLYSVKVEPEAAAIIEKYRGVKGLLCISDRWSDHRNFRHQMNKALQLIGASRKGLGGKKGCDGVFPGLSTYWARHTWATVAASLDIPKETIAAALGHGGNTVTDIYIDFDQRKVDEANRRVLDYVLYGRL